MSEQLVLLGIVGAAGSGLPGLFLGPRSLTGPRLATLMAGLAAGLGLTGIGLFWVSGNSRHLRLPWAIPGGEFHVAVDGLSAFFLLPIFLVFLLGSVYGLGYWKQTEHPENGRKLRLFYGLLTAGMALLVIARNSIVFLVAWEVMALSGYFLITTEDEDQLVREAGWIYFVATHIATLTLFALFALLRSVSGSFTLAPIPEHALTSGTATAIFVLTLVGFGVKAGMMPLHVWLPSSHAIAPSHVSAILSGVLLKMGIYGIVRIVSFFPNPPVEWGATLVGLGAVSGVLGVAFAIGQHDLKRLLAYHSIENIGIILIGIGLALAGRSLGRSDWIILGLSGALLHVWNHAFFKALLFLSAGSAIHATRTRDIDRLGGLAKSMPATAAFFLIGAVAICGLPPLNGFVSEFLIYLGLLGSLGLDDGPAFPGIAFASAALALIGALAVACFVKVFGAAFLGTARSEHARHAHESALSLTLPMGVLAACCFAIGLVPTVLTPILAKAISAWAPEVGEAGTRLAGLAPLGCIAAMAWLMLIALALASGLLWFGLRKSAVGTGSTWGCGYLAPTSRMQYTSSSFALMLVGLFAWALPLRTQRPRVIGLFPPATAFHSHVSDPVLDGAVLPAFRFGAWLISWFRVFQQGNIQSYLLYIFVALLALLLWR